MTVTQQPAATVAAAARHPAGFGRLLLAEWTKIRSVRSTFWTLIVFVAVTVGLTALLSVFVVAAWDNNTPQAVARDARIAADPVSFVLGAGIGLGQLALLVLGVLVMTTEYSTGVIRASLLAVPRRVPMLVAKAVVFAALVLVLAEIVTFASFFIGAAILHSKVVFSLSNPGVTRAVVGSGLYLTLIGLFALGIGGIIRVTAGAVATAIGAILVLPILSSLLPGSWGAHVNAYLPEQAGSLITQAHQSSGALLSPWQGFGVFCIWTALLLGVNGYLLVRRDA
jgi:ABC-2 type transport system permease protein